MNYTLLEYSRTHFAKAQGSPFTVDPLQRLVNYDGLTPFGDQVFKGCATLEHLPINAPTKALLQNMRNKLPSPVPQSHPILYEELQKGIQKWPEKTTTLPSGRHLGIYKSLQCHVIKKDDKQSTTPPTPDGIITQGHDVLFLIFDIMTLALRHTYTLNRWKTVWMLFIEKELGNPDLNRL